MVDAGRDLWRSSGPIPLLKQGLPKPADQNHVQYMKNFTCEPAYNSRYIFLYVNKKF